MGRIDATTIIAHFDDHLSALMIGVEIDRAARGLSRGEPFISRLDAVVDGVAHEMHQRLSERIENAFVEISVLTGDVEGHILAALFGDIADDAREAAEKLLDGHHANFKDAFVKFIEHAGLKSESFSQLCANRITGMALVEFSQRAVEHGLADD